MIDCDAKVTNNKPTGEHTIKALQYDNTTEDGDITFIQEHNSSIEEQTKKPLPIFYVF